MGYRVLDDDVPLKRVSRSSAVKLFGGALKLHPTASYRSLVTGHGFFPSGPGRTNATR